MNDSIKKELLNSKKEKLSFFLNNIDKLLDGKKVKEEFKKDEFQKIFSCLIQGVDIVNTYDRRKFGVSDNDWDQSVSDLNEVLGNNEK